MQLTFNIGRDEPKSNFVRQMRAEACASELQSVLARHRCELRVVVVLPDGAIVPAAEVLEMPATINLVAR